MNIDNIEKQELLKKIEEMEREMRGLKRKLALSDYNLNRAKLIANTQIRVDSIMNTSLKKEIQFFKLVLENITNILLLLDFDGRFAYASKTFLEDAGLANFGLISGRHYHEVLKNIISMNSLKALINAVDTAIANKNTVILEKEITFLQEKNSRTFKIYITPMTDDDGKSTGIMALFNDITEINDALEKASRASLAKSDFLANMSHEIRTPLNAVIGMTTIAQGSTDMEKVHYCLDKITDSSKHLLGVINDILDMSKIESNHFELCYSEFVFEKMLLRIIDVMQFKIEEKNIKFTLNCDPSIPYAIYSDEQRLAQIIMNLLSNAVKFTPENGKVSIDVIVDSCVNEDYVLKISVKDTGIGIKEEQRPRLFKAFSQADTSISRKFGGTGLGLIISKNIIDLLGGDITFESQEGVGTTFIFHIKTRACKLEPIAKLDSKDMKILVVDDEKEVCSSFAIYAKKLGVHCSTAESANEALEILKNQPHNIIFVDWKMPEVDGIEFIKKLNLISNSKNIIVVMISAANWSEIEKEAKALGVKEFISKPILLPLIENVLDKYCENLKGENNEKAYDFSNKTILLVDDIDINREIIISLLEDTKINIVCAENGKEALEKFKATPNIFDLIFMDVQMPEMDGYEATRQIRALNTNKAINIPIVAMTANVFKEDIEKCIESGMNDHIGKPINIDEIFAKIKMLS